MRGAAGDGAKTLYFHGHFDVVPAQDRTQFTARRRDGRIVGRGSADMKGGIVSMLYGAAAARELSLLGDGRIVLYLVCDEETGSVTGAGHLRAARLIDPHAVATLTAEPSGSSIWNAARGALSLRVEVAGREAHVGQADRGVNAFQHLVHIATPALDYAREMAARLTKFPMNPEDALGTMLVVGGQFGGGSNFNVVPGSAFFTVDGRYNPEEDLGAELQRLTDIINKAAAEAGASISIEVTQQQPAASTEPTHPAAAALAKVVTDVEGAAARFEMCAGILETRWYGQLGIPAFGLRRRGRHQPVRRRVRALRRRHADFLTSHRTPAVAHTPSDQLTMPGHPRLRAAAWAPSSHTPYQLTNHPAGRSRTTHCPQRSPACRRRWTWTNWAPHSLDKPRRTIAHSP